MEVIKGTETSYKLTGTILGEGLSVVKLAYRQSDKLKVAVKVVKETKDPKELRQHACEIKALRTLDHKRIVKLYEHIKAKPEVLIMEYIEGEELCDYLAEQEYGLINENEVRTILSQVLQAIAYSHKTGFVHRDIKLENIMLKKNGQSIVIDWGFAEQKGDLSGKSAGSIFYIPPECLRLEMGTPSPEDKRWIAGSS